MAGQSFRFLHTCGFQLESTLVGLAEVPDHLRETLAGAPFQAVEQVTEAAIREDVDFVLLSGDVVDPTSGGPAALSFLQRQCEQLRARKIHVYWAASRLDMAGNFLDRLQLPDNVHIFPSDRVERLTHFRGQSPICTLFGRSWNEKRPLRAAEFVRDNQEGFQLAVLYGRGDLETGPKPGIHYWALGGGESVFDAASSKTQAVHCPGRPQGFTPANTGSHGCTIVNVDGDGEIRIRRIETDVVRWHEEKLIVDGSSSMRDTRQSLRLHVEKLMAGQHRPTLVKWTLAGPGRFDLALVKRKDREEILDWLRSDYGHRTPAIWSVQLEIEPPDSIPDDWCDDDTILGDFLRAIREQQRDESKPLNLRQYLPDIALPNELTEALVGSESRGIQETLRETTLLGFDLLRGDESPGRSREKYSSHAETEGVTT
jgi:DNA repair protein SbcD/Mre11